MTFSISDIAPLVGILTATVAIVGLILQLRKSALGLQTQVLLSLEARFYSAEMKALRQRAARKLLAGEAVNSELEDTLDFLHSVVMLVERKVVDRALALEFYKYWIARYWLVSRSYVERLRTIDDPATYSKLGRLAETIMQQETAVNYSADAMQAFLAREAGLDAVPTPAVSEGPEQ